MDYLLVALFSFAVALLTFFSGFGLGTILLPVFALFFPVPVAVAATAVVHLMNNISKVILVGKHASKDIVLRFGIPAVIAAFGGAWSLGYLTELPELLTYSIGEASFEILPVKLTIGIVMVLFALFELIPGMKKINLSPRYIPLGGILSGFFGGLSGHQGALRTLFLTRAGLQKQAFIGTIALISMGVDVMRLFVYGIHRFSHIGSKTALFVLVATLSAWAGSFLGSRLLTKITMRTVRLLIGIMLLVLGSALASGIV